MVVAFAGFVDPETPSSSLRYALYLQTPTGLSPLVSNSLSTIHSLYLPEGTHTIVGLVSDPDGGLSAEHVLVANIAPLPSSVSTADLIAGPLESQILARNGDAVRQLIDAILGSPSVQLEENDVVALAEASSAADAMDAQSSPSRLVARASTVLGLIRSAPTSASVLTAVDGLWNALESAAPVVDPELSTASDTALPALPFADVVSALVSANTPDATRLAFRGSNLLATGVTSLLVVPDTSRVLLVTSSDQTLSLALTRGPNPASLSGDDVCAPAGFGASSTPLDATQGATRACTRLGDDIALVSYAGEGAGASELTFAGMTGAGCAKWSPSSSSWTSAVECNFVAPATCACSSLAQGHPILLEGASPASTSSNSSTTRTLSLVPVAGLFVVYVIAVLVWRLTVSRRSSRDTKTLVPPSPSFLARHLYASLSVVTSVAWTSNELFKISLALVSISALFAVTSVVLSIAPTLSFVLVGLIAVVAVAPFTYGIRRWLSDSTAPSSMGAIEPELGTLSASALESSSSSDTSDDETAYEYLTLSSSLSVQQEEESGISSDVELGPRAGRFRVFILGFTALVLGAFGALLVLSSVPASSAMVACASFFVALVLDLVCVQSAIALVV